MDKRTAWVSGVLALAIFLGLVGTGYSMHYRQAERLDVLQRESREKDNQIQLLADQVKSLKEQVDQQQKTVEDVKKKANF